MAMSIGVCCNLLRRHQTYSRANAVDLIVNPFVNNVSGDLISFVYPYSDAVAPGGADTNVPSYNFRLCITNASDRVPFPKYVSELCVERFVLRACCLTTMVVCVLT